MKVANLKDMFKGWFVGNFQPTVLQTNDVEVAVKEYQAGSKEELHYHKIATELTVIVRGKVKMNGTEYGEGSIIVVEPGEGTDFQVMESTITVVVKVPGANNDKYLDRERC